MFKTVSTQTIYRCNLIKVGVNLPFLGVSGSELFTWNQTPQSFTRNFFLLTENISDQHADFKKKKALCVKLLLSAVNPSLIS